MPILSKMTNPNYYIVRTLEQGLRATRKLGYPVAIHPAFTLHGSGSTILYEEEPQRLADALNLALLLSPLHEALVMNNDRPVDLTLIDAVAGTQ